MVRICEQAGIANIHLSFSEVQPIKLANVKKALLEHGTKGDISMVAIVHCETSTGVLNQIESIGELLKNNEMDNKTGSKSILYTVDAMSTFGGVQSRYEHVDFLIR